MLNYWCLQGDFEFLHANSLLVLSLVGFQLTTSCELQDDFALLVVGRLKSD